MKVFEETSVQFISM